MFGVVPSESERIVELERLVSEARAELATTTEKLAITAKQLEAARDERDRLRLAYQRLFEQVELLRRRIYAAKAERVNPLQLELEFKEAKDKLDKMAAELDALDNGGEQSRSNPQDAKETSSELDVGNRPAGKPPAKDRPKPKGRRNLSELDMPEKRIEILDPVLEGQAERIGWEESCQFGYQRPGRVRIVMARAKYKTEASESEPVKIVTAPLPRALLSRSILAPSLLGPHHC